MIVLYYHPAFEKQKKNIGFFAAAAGGGTPGEGEANSQTAGQPQGFIDKILQKIPVLGSREQKGPSNAPGTASSETESVNGTDAGHGTGQAAGSAGDQESNGFHVG